MTQPKSKTFQWAMLPVIFTLAWPTMLEETLHTAVQYIDTAMVGALGTQATAAVGATTTIGWLIGTSISALGVGFLSFIAQACGSGQREKARRIAAQTVLAVLVVGVLFTLLPLTLSHRVAVWMQVDESIHALTAQYFFILYLPMLPRTASILFGTALRAAGDTKTPMRVGMLVNLLNVLLNFLLIYPTRSVRLWGLDLSLPGAGLGVSGAAIASAISFTVGGVCMTVKFWRHPVLSPRGQRISPDWQLLRPCLRVALPNMLQRFGTSLGYVAFAAMINALGQVATAAHTIANTVESAFYIPAYGMQTAAATLSGNTLGARDNQRMKALTRMILLSETVLMVLSGGLLMIFAPQMMRLFSSSAEVIALGSIVLRMVAVSEPFYGVSIIIEGLMMGVGRTVRPFVFNVSGMWGVRILGTFVCTALLGMGLISAWACMIAHNMLVFALFTVHYLRGRWNPLQS